MTLGKINGFELSIVFVDLNIVLFFYFRWTLKVINDTVNGTGKLVCMRGELDLHELTISLYYSQE